MDIKQLKDTAAALPLAPGVYIMRDKANHVIYVGKAKKLKNRVSQYFQDTASHTIKTKLMVSKVDHFDVIVAASEFEALVLECSLIKQYQPKYNILLKDDKGYPFVRLDMRVPYPEFTVVNGISDDGAEYFGPFGSRGITNSILQTIQTVFRLPNCSLKFPRDIGKDRPCLNYHMNQCEGWCQTDREQSTYRAAIEQARQLFLGNFKIVADTIRQQMVAAADALNFELAAAFRDRLNAIEALRQKQLVTAGVSADTDVVGYGRTETKACFTVLHYREGKLIDKDFEILSAPDDDDAALSSLLKQYYLSRGFAPRMILLPSEIEDAALFEVLLMQKFGIKTAFKVPRRGEKASLISLACTNAKEEAERVTLQDERHNATVAMLGKMLCIDPPNRIESFDISNISGTDIVASMVVFINGRPKRSAYKRFKINDLSGQDDYASMRQAILRRFTRLKDGSDGFEEPPDLLLIDGGSAHAKVAEEVLSQLDLKLFVLGMVKDDRHRTRALITPDGNEIRIDNQQYVFSLIGQIQEETHRFAITYHRKLRSKRLQYSQLDAIPGIGGKRKQILLKAFRSLKGIAAAELRELEQYLPRNAALAVYKHFREEEGNECAL